MHGSLTTLKDKTFVIILGKLHNFAKVRTKQLWHILNRESFLLQNFHCLQYNAFTEPLV